MESLYQGYIFAELYGILEKKALFHKLLCKDIGFCKVEVTQHISSCGLYKLKGFSKWFGTSSSLLSCSKARDLGYQ